MRILVVGGGAREHALVWKLSSEAAVTKILCTPGNPGMAEVAQCLPVEVGALEELLAVAKRDAVDLTVVGPELPLSLGLVDLFRSHGRAIVGPTRRGAALESSKAFAKTFMAKHGVPTARFRVCDSAPEALDSLRRGEFGYPVVIKADGLAAGKGVVIAADQREAELAVLAAMEDRRFGAAGERVVIEEFLVGEEASYFVLTDGTGVVPLGSAQDHKRIFDGDRGPNTGGMGAFAPSSLVTPEVERRVLHEIVHPVLEGMREEGERYSGILYVGLMLTEEGPKVVEFNVRLGDPEAQVVLPMLDEDLSGLLSATAAGTLPSRPARIRAEPHVGVVLASRGYPDAVADGMSITGLDEAAAVPGALVFHAGTRRRDASLVTAGGRILTVVGSGSSYAEAIEVAYKAVGHIHFEGMQFRSDIGRKALQPSL